ncbi:MAG: alpha/beta fold hydrolase [Phaeodactylibacter sp.]|nr:alpha/beta fold hydrolase [Phaeodactylibacter sp.]
MPVLTSSSYPGAPYYQINGHLQTIIPSAFRKVEDVCYERERITLSDGDFLDLDWLRADNDRLLILTHGLEGNSSRHYMKGMARYFHQRGWDALAWNCRTCSGEMNHCLRMYNHGDIDDIQEVIAHVLQSGQYRSIALVGFSMGGNITLKYLGVNGTNVPQEIRAAVAFSAPVDLASSVDILEHPKNWFYRRRFMKKLKAKIEAKAAQFPEAIDLSNFERIHHWRDFDEYFSAPISGYASAADFYEKGSSLNFMKGLTVPTLLVNAKNDPLLTAACYPRELAAKHPKLTLEMPKSGGHVGFELRKSPDTWSEHRAYTFVEQVLGQN